MHLEWKCLLLVNKCKPQKERKEWKYRQKIHFGAVREFEYVRDSVQDDKTEYIFQRNSWQTIKKSMKQIPFNCVREFEYWVLVFRLSQLRNSKNKKYIFNYPGTVECMQISRTLRQLVRDNKEKKTSISKDILSWF